MDSITSIGLDIGDHWNDNSSEPPPIHEIVLPWIPTEKEENDDNLEQEDSSVSSVDVREEDSDTSTNQVSLTSSHPNPNDNQASGAWMILQRDIPRVPSQSSFTSAKEWKKKGRLNSTGEMTASTVASSYGTSYLSSESPRDLSARGRRNHKNHPILDRPHSSSWGSFEDYAGYSSGDSSRWRKPSRRKRERKKSCPKNNHPGAKNAMLEPSKNSSLDRQLQERCSIDKYDCHYRHGKSKECVASDYDTYDRYNHTMPPLINSQPLFIKKSRHFMPVNVNPTHTQQQQQQQPHKNKGYLYPQYPSHDQDQQPECNFAFQNYYACHAKKQSRNVVSFSTIEIRFYERILGDNPSCSNGPPVSIGWDYDTSNVISLPLEKFEYMRSDRLDLPDLVLSRVEREEILEEMGYKRGEIVDAVRTNRRIKNQRRQTVNNLAVMSVEEAVEKASRKMKNVLLRKVKRKSKSSNNFVTDCESKSSSQSEDNSSVNSSLQSKSILKAPPLD